MAQIAFDYIWLLLFSDENTVEPDYSVTLLEELSLTLSAVSAPEQNALAEVARQARDKLLAEPDEHGYTPRALVTDEQRVFLDTIISGKLFHSEWWSS